MTYAAVLWRMTGDADAACAEQSSTDDIAVAMARFFAAWEAMDADAVRSARARADGAIRCTVSAVYPGASELCNGVDDDCDAVADEDAVDPSTWYLDDDNDGFGDPADATQSCTSPSGRVADNGDCDDKNDAVNPAAIEVVLRLAVEPAGDEMVVTGTYGGTEVAVTLDRWELEDSLLVLSAAGTSTANADDKFDNLEFGCPEL